MGVELNGKFGYVDKYGTLITDFIYSGLSIFENGIGVVEVDGNEGVINEVGKMVIPPLQKYVKNLGEGLVLFIGSYDMEGTMWNTNGKRVGDLYGGYFPFNNGISMFDRNEERLSINTKGKIVAKGWFENDGTPKQASNKGNISSSNEITKVDNNNKTKDPNSISALFIDNAKDYLAYYEILKGACKLYKTSNTNNNMLGVRNSLGKVITINRDILNILLRSNDGSLSVEEQKNFLLIAEKIDKELLDFSSNLSTPKMTVLEAIAIGLARGARQ